MVRSFTMSKDWLIDYFFTAKGRLPRLQYLIRNFATLLLLLPLIAIVPAANMVDESVAIVFTVVFVIIHVYAQACIAIRRLHDMDISGWLYLLQFIPYVNIVLVLMMLFKSGTPRPNRFDKEGNANLDVDVFD